MENADEVDHKNFRAEISELERALLRDDRTDEERHQRNDGHRTYAHVIDLVDDGGRRYAAPSTELHLRATNGGAQNKHAGHEVRPCLDDIPSDGLEDAA